MALDKYESVCLEFEAAVALETKQNIERDQRILGEAEPAELYEEEARLLLKDYGQGFIPDFPDHKLVTVAVQTDK